MAQPTWYYTAIENSKKNPIELGIAVDYYQGNEVDCNWCDCCSQQMNGTLSALKGVSTILIEQNVLDNWTSIPGNSIEYTYYSGVSGNNPSGNENVRFARYYDAGTLTLTKEFTYDANDNVLSATAS